MNVNWGSGFVFKAQLYPRTEPKSKTFLSRGLPDRVLRVPEPPDGILCKANMGRGEGNLPLAEMEKVKGEPNKQLVEDNAYWFWNNR